MSRKYSDANRRSHQVMNMTSSTLKITIVPAVWFLVPAKTVVMANAMCSGTGVRHSTGSVRCQDLSSLLAQSKAHIGGRRWKSSSLRPRQMPAKSRDQLNCVSSLPFLGAIVTSEEIRHRGRDIFGWTINSRRGSDGFGERSKHRAGRRRLDIMRNEVSSSSHRSARLHTAHHARIAFHVAGTEKFDQAPPSVRLRAERLHAESSPGSRRLFCTKILETCEEKKKSAPTGDSLGCVR